MPSGPSGLFYLHGLTFIRHGKVITPIAMFGMKLISHAGIKVSPRE